MLGPSRRSLSGHGRSAPSPAGEGPQWWGQPTFAIASGSDADAPKGDLAAHAAAPDRSLAGERVTGRSRLMRAPNSIPIRRNGLGWNARTH
jgi:hypothetical protein